VNARLARSDLAQVEWVRVVLVELIVRPDAPHVTDPDMIKNKLL